MRATDPSQFPSLNASDLEVSPLERAETIPSTWYSDPAFHRLDLDAVIARSWQVVGDLGQLANPGDCIVGDVAGEPVIVVRDKDGEIHSFYNVCRHRGGPLAVKDGNVSMLKCLYHGWTYRLDGMLRGVPHWDRVELFDKKDYGLVPVRHAVWEGQIFVSLDPAQPIESSFAGIRERVAPMQLASLKFARRADYDVRCNWKVYVDNFLEGYHVPHVHPELVKLYDFQSYRTDVFPTYSLQHSPLSADENIYSNGTGEALYYQVFPNYMLNILPNRLQTNVVVPVAPDRCKVIFRYYYADVASAGARRKIEEDLAYSDKVQQEDIEICERVQQGLQSRAYDRGRFSVQFENAVYHFQKLLKESYRAWKDRT
jgi:choline monooxygenase